MLLASGTAVWYYSGMLPVPVRWVLLKDPEGKTDPAALYNPRTLYNALFDSAWETLAVFARDEKHLGAQIGATMVLHTWGQVLSLHPRVHAVVPGGGLTKTGRYNQKAG